MAQFHTLSFFFPGKQLEVPTLHFLEGRGSQMDCIKSQDIKMTHFTFFSLHFFTKIKIIFLVFHLCSKNLLILILSHEMLKKNLSRQDKMREKLNVTELRSVSSEISHLLSSTEKFTEMNSLLFSLSNVSDLCLTQFL